MDVLRGAGPGAGPGERAGEGSGLPRGDRKPSLSSRGMTASDPYFQSLAAAR